MKKNAGNRRRSLVQVMFFTVHNSTHGTEFGVHAVYLAGRLLTPPRCCEWGGKCQTACKPGSVAGRGPRDGHSSGAPVTERLARPTRASDPKADCGGLGPPRAPIRLAPLYGLAPGGVCRAGPVAGPAVRSYRTLSPLPAGLTARAGGLLSVALSLGSPPPGVTRLRASVEPGLSSAARGRRRPSGRLADSGYAPAAARSRLSPGRRPRCPPPRTVPAALSRRGKWRAPCAGHESAGARRSPSIRRIAEASAPAATSPCSSSPASARLPAWPSGSRRPRA